LQRNPAIDAYRGFVMFLMMAEVLHLSRLAQADPGNAILAFLAYHQSHVPWAGCSLHDLIQPSFSLLVGVALPYSLASRKSKGSSFKELLLHALVRSFILIALGIILRRRFTFEDTLTQIGLGYPFLFLLGFAKPRLQWIALSAILFLYWLAWALYPIQPSTGFVHNFTGFAAHWNKNANLGHAFDQTFLNLFPRDKPFIANSGGYLTLSFIPTLGTMLLGLIAGRWLTTLPRPAALRRIFIAAAILLSVSLALHFGGVGPIVKRIWTPSWTLFSGALCFVLLAAFHYLLPKPEHPLWSMPLLVIGRNSIAAYLIAHLLEPAFTPLFPGWATLLLYWLLLFAMYRRNFFLRI
jgi:heparan-alpha-glucosaminide N-acetyltransferase